MIEPIHIEAVIVAVVITFTVPVIAYLLTGSILMACAVVIAHALLTFGTQFNEHLILPIVDVVHEHRPWKPCKWEWK